MKKYDNDCKIQNFLREISFILSFGFVSVTFIVTLNMNIKCIRIDKQRDFSLSNKLIK